ncbi:MAG: lipoate--protein ligase family protein [Gammaproteobacteria bacterium]|nr:MAG: lipoate--protein ligase family protein [Gammaproteobacteria bacterium]
MSEPRNSLVKYDTIDAALDQERLTFQQVIAGKLEDACSIWSTSQCLVAPYAFGRHKHFDKAAQISRDMGWPVSVRQTGGGVTPQGPGIMNISLALANTSGNKLSIADSYQLICNPIISELHLLDVDAQCASVEGAFCDGAYNVVANGRKLAGTAQRRSRLKQQPDRQGIFAHALLLFDADLEAAIKAVNRLYLLMGNEQRCRASAHCNFSGLYTNTEQKPPAEYLGQRLLEGYGAEIEKLRQPKSSCT